jgi:hypothetical protein
MRALAGLVDAPVDARDKGFRKILSPPSNACA